MTYEQRQWSIFLHWRCTYTVSQKTPHDVFFCDNFGTCTLISIIPSWLHSRCTAEEVLQNMPPHLKYVSTKPCEIWMFDCTPRRQVFTFLTVNICLIIWLWRLLYNITTCIQNVRRQHARMLPEVAPKCPEIDVFDYPTVVWRPLSREPLRISAQTLCRQKLDSMAYIFAATVYSMGLSSFIFLWWAP